MGLYRYGVVVGAALMALGFPVAYVAEVTGPRWLLIVALAALLGGGLLIDRARELTRADRRFLSRHRIDG